MPSSGLRMMSLVLGMEARTSSAARDQRGADELRELHDRQLLGVVAQRARLVDDARAFALGLLQQVRGVEIFAVEGRVLAHQHGVEVGQRGLAAGGFGEPGGRVTGQRDVAHLRHHPLPALPAQMAAARTR
jgi:hypothetical protein